MKEPGDEEHDERRSDQCERFSPGAQAEVYGIEDDLHHEVLPVDLNPPPEVGEARRQVEEPVCFGQAKAEQVQDPDDHVKLTRHAQVEREVRDYITNQVGAGQYVRR